MAMLHRSLSDMLPHPARSAALAILLALSLSGVAWSQPLSADRQSAEGGASESALKAMFEQGTALFLGQTDPQSKEKGLALIKEAAQAGQVDAQMYYGLLIEKNMAPSENKTEAARWLLSAAKSGSGAARLYLGELFLNGDGVPKDIDWACYYIRLAVDSNQLTPDEGRYAASLLRSLNAQQDKACPRADVANKSAP